MTSFAINAFGQVQSFTDIPQSLLDNYEEMGKNDSLLLNEYESQYLNFIFEKSRKDFDFTGKKNFKQACVITREKELRKI